MSSDLLFDPPPLRTGPGAIAEKTAQGEALLSPLLFHPEKNRREYRGEIRRQEGKYLGITQWGKSGKCGSHQKTVYSGKSLSEAKRAVEVMLEKKIASGYLVKNGGSPLFPVK